MQILHTSLSNRQKTTCDDFEKCHRHYLFVEGEIGISNRIPEECTIHDNYFCPPAGRALTFLRQEK
ncbi:MAG: hypothetical protein H6544_07535 [Prevotellaceae bacterium]|nr:hypothetical protein [Prevotellaceae bacterium]